jgi:monoamine oxidase
MRSDFSVVVVGGGAAGVAAARRLHDLSVDVLLVEARDRLGGRAWTRDNLGYPLDLGCGWLHSADHNEWRLIAQEQGFAVDRTPPPWSKPSLNFKSGEQSEFGRAMNELFARLDAFPDDAPDVPASRFVDANGHWFGLMNAVSTYISGVELDGVSARDLSRYADTGVDWRIREGYGRLIKAYGSDLPVRFECPVQRIDHTGRKLRLETPHGVLVANVGIIALPASLLAAGDISFDPSLNGKREAAAGLPLGLADKLYLSLADPEDFEIDSRSFGRTDTPATGAYHFRPLDRPVIEAYFAGKLARELEESGEAAFFDFALSELTGLFGRSFARRVKPVGLHMWGKDPFARGSYSYAVPGKSDCRGELAEPVDGRLFFAGEACSRHDFSTAHGAYRTGIRAAEQAAAALQGKLEVISSAP